MSRGQTPTPTSISSSSSRSSYSRVDSDTTPSPSSGNKFSAFNPLDLSSRLAILEASQALSHASRTLSVAAQAMSKAAASLAAIGVYHNDDDTLKERNSEENMDWAASPDWTQSAYNLELPNVSNNNGVHGADENRKITESEILDSFTKSKYFNETAPSPTGSTPDLSTRFAETHPPAPHATLTNKLPTESTDQTTYITPSNAVEPTLPTIPVSPKVKSPPDNNPTKGSRPVPYQSASESHPIALVPVTSLSHSPEDICCNDSCSNLRSGQPTGIYTCPNLTQATLNLELLSGPTYIILDHGFNLLPALCHIVGRHMKTVCLYNYSGFTATLQIATMLRSNVSLPVTVPESSKADRLAAIANKFNSVDSGILLWPGCKALPTINGLVDSPNIELIHLGEPGSMNSGVTCSKTTVIMARSDLSEPQVVGNRRNYHMLDKLNQICNQQGPESPLQPFCVWLRSRLAKDSYARGFYLDWILQRRKRNPSESIVEIVRLANQYAEEFLLRGESQKHGEPVGGQPSISETTLKAQRLEAAVQAGVLLVS